jgi:hypothetical protein
LPSIIRLPQSRNLSNRKSRDLSSKKFYFLSKRKPTIFQLTQRWDWGFPEDLSRQLLCHRANSQWEIRSVIWPVLHHLE